MPKQQDVASQLIAWVMPNIRKQIQRQGRFFDDTVDDLVQSTVVGIMRRRVWQEISTGDNVDADVKKQLNWLVKWEVKEAIRDFAGKENVPRYAQDACASVKMAARESISVSHAAYALSTQATNSSAETEAIETLDKTDWHAVLNDLAKLGHIIICTASNKFIGLNCALLAERLRIIVIMGEHKQLRRAELLGDVAVCDTSTLPGPLACVIERLAGIAQCSQGRKPNNVTVPQLV